MKILQWLFVICAALYFLNLYLNQKINKLKKQSEKAERHAKYKLEVRERGDKRREASNGTTPGEEGRMYTNKKGDIFYK